MTAGVGGPSDGQGEEEDELEGDDAQDVGEGSSVSLLILFGYSVRGEEVWEQARSGDGCSRLLDRLTAFCSALYGRRLLRAMLIEADSLYPSSLCLYPFAALASLRSSFPFPFSRNNSPHPERKPLLRRKPIANSVSSDRSRSASCKARRATWRSERCGPLPSLLTSFRLSPEPAIGRPLREGRQADAL
jgi:hypothetical protein